MQSVSALYNSIYESANHWFEISLVIGEPGVLIDEISNRLLFAGTAILVDTGSPESGGFREEFLYSISTYHALFNEDYPVLGSVVAGEIDIVMTAPTADIPRQAMLRPYCRVTDGERYSEWIPQGVYYVDTKEYTKNSDGISKVTIHGYDILVKMDELYPSDTSHSYPLLDTTMVSFIANTYNLSVDSRNAAIMTNGYTFALPIGFSCREVLGMIASAYAGAFIITPSGELRLVQINEQPKETRILIDTFGNQLIFGTGGNEVKILV